MKTKLLTIVALLVTFGCDVCLSKGWGTKKKNRHTVQDWDVKHQSFDECTTSKCKEPCNKKATISTASRSESWDVG